MMYSWPLVWGLVWPLVLAVVVERLMRMWMRNKRRRGSIHLEPPSTSKLATHADEELEDLSLQMLEPKHKIFLSHSGAQKPLVEQLCQDLEASGHYPFFDMRDDSLPKGKKFASLIFRATKQCRVALVVISRGFLTSRWPMQELVAFVNAKKTENKNLDLLPLFFDLSVEDLSDKCISNRWVKEWRKLAKNDPKGRVDVDQWKMAIQEIRTANGLIFAKFGNSEASYREAVVKAIFGLVPPDLLHDISEVQGCDRMCKILSGRFVGHFSSRDKKLQAKKLGLYGMGGLGKTTISKALCNYFQAEFYGRVCHVELGSEDRLVLQKKVLQKLLRVREDLLKNISDESEGQNCLKKHMRQHPVFLVIDNVVDEEGSRNEARAYLKAGFHADSKIMVTSRSRDVVKALLFDPEYCKPMPDLVMDEAATIFLRKAAPGKTFSSLQPKEKRIVDLCLEQCRFSPDGDPYADVRKDGQFHPLALGALGVYFHDIDNSNLLLWEEYLDDFDKLKLSRECPRIFLILGLQFGTFDTTKKLIFLDAALYAHGRVLWGLNSFQDWVSWLAALHKESEKVVIRKLTDLQRNAMINMGESAVTTHDLYKEYAEWYVTETGDSKDWCIHHRHAESLPHKLNRSPPGGCWPDLVRISLEGLKSVKFPLKKVQEWRNIVVLQLHSCTNLTEIDLHGLSCLCHLELVCLKKLEILTFSANLDERLAEYPIDLKFVILEQLESLKHLPNFSPCTSMRMFIMRNCSSLVEPPSLESCASLQILQMHWYTNQLHAPNLSAMTSLRDLSIEHLKGPYGDNCIELEGLSSLTSLRKKLYLYKLPVERLPGLEMLTNVRLVSLEHCERLTELPDISGLTNLEVLNVSWTKVKEIRGVDSLLQLRTLDCRWCQELMWLPDLHQLTNLKLLNTQGCNRLMVHPKLPKHPFVHEKDEVIGKGTGHFYELEDLGTNLELMFPSGET